MDHVHKNELTTTTLLSIEFLANPQLKLDRPSTVDCCVFVLLLTAIWGHITIHSSRWHRRRLLAAELWRPLVIEWFSDLPMFGVENDNDYGFYNVKKASVRGCFGCCDVYTGAEFTCKPWHIFSLTLSLKMPIKNHINWVINNRMIIRQCNITYIILTMSFIIIKLELSFTLKLEEIAADLRQLLAFERFSNLPVVTG